MYCSQTLQAGTPPVNAVFSATSRDLINWTPDPGRRIGPGAPTLQDDANHPTVIQNADGTVSLVYYQRRPNISTPREMISTSADGLTFSVEYDLGLAGTEPSIMKRADGTMLLYYGGQTPTAGSTIYVAHVTPIVR